MVNPTSLINNLSNFSNEDLLALMEKADKEIGRRKSAEKSKLIENFKSAFLALQSAGIDVHCSDYVDDIDFRVNSWEDFYFD